jgi:3',5'-cyclic AMP phosphodiesterase CpdA
MPTFRVVQISDTHLSRSHAYFQDNWDAFVDLMKIEKPDRILITGDLCINGPIQKDDFAFAREQMDRLAVPWRAIPGNHDAGETPPDSRLGKPITAKRRQNWLSYFGDDFWVEDWAGWRFIGLNAQLMESGLKGEAEQQAMLEDALENADGRPIAIANHKPLYKLTAGETGKSLSAMWPKSRKYLMRLCERHKVKLFMSGHLHTYRASRHKGTSLIWAPSSAFINPTKGNWGLKMVRRLGFIRYEFDGRRFRHELAQPPLFINHDVSNWQTLHGSTTNLPPRPLNRHAPARD